jgi:hypothetical protein
MGRVHPADQRGIHPAHHQTLSCTGRPFTEHRNIPALALDPASTVPAWRQVASALAEVIQSGSLAPGTY